MKKRLQRLQDRLKTERELRRAYADQIRDIGRMLVRAGILTAREIRRQGVRYAVSDRLEPRTGHVQAKQP